MRVSTLASIAVFALCSTAAQAQVTMLSGPGNIDGDENVLFHGDGLILDGLLVQGKLNQSEAVVNFFDAGTLLSAKGGQAKLEAQTGTFSALSIAMLDPQLDISSVILNINAVANGSVTFNALDTSTGGTVSQTFDLDKNGQNFFRIFTEGSSSLSLLSFTTTVGIQDIKQVRIGSAAPVPEPSTLAGLAACSLALIRRRKAKKG